VHLVGGKVPEVACTGFCTEVACIRPIDVVDDEVARNLPLRMASVFRGPESCSVKTCRLHATGRLGPLSSPTGAPGAW
jgi:hypothetical protein